MFKSKKIQHGFSLIEVLVSLLVLSVGMLGLGGLQMAAVKGTANAHARTVASALMHDLTDRMRANPENASNPAEGFYQNDITCASSVRRCYRDSCNPQQKARYDVKEILCGIQNREAGIRHELLNGNLLVEQTPANCVMAGINYTDAQYRVDISWGERNLHQNQTGDNNTRSQTLTACVRPSRVP